MHWNWQPHLSTTQEVSLVSRYPSQAQGQQRVEYWRWRIYDEARNRWSDTRHLMTETDALLHHPGAIRIEGSREVRVLSETDEDSAAMPPLVWRQRSP